MRQFQFQQQQAPCGKFSSDRSLQRHARRSSYTAAASPAPVPARCAQLVLKQLLEVQRDSTAPRVSSARACTSSVQIQLHSSSAAGTSSSVLQRAQHSSYILHCQQERRTTVRMQQFLSFSDISSAAFTAAAASLIFGDSARTACVVRIIIRVNFSLELSASVAAMTMAQHDGDMPSRFCTSPAAFSFGNFRRSAGACNTTFSVTSAKTSMRPYTQQQHQQPQATAAVSLIGSETLHSHHTFQPQSSSITLDDTTHCSSLFSIARYNPHKRC